MEGKENTILHKNTLSDKIVSSDRLLYQGIAQYGREGKIDEKE